MGPTHGTETAKASVKGTRAAKLACRPVAMGESCPEAASWAAGQPVRLTDRDPIASLSLRWCTLQARRLSFWQPYPMTVCYQQGARWTCQHGSGSLKLALRPESTMRSKAVV